MKGILDKLILLWKGHMVDFNEEQLFWIIKNQSRLNINTLSIQKSSNEKYICVVDQITVNAYRNFSVEESQI